MIITRRKEKKQRVISKGKFYLTNQFLITKIGDKNVQ